MRRLLRIAFYVFDGGVLILFLVGYVAQYIHPKYTWWAELIATGLPYLSVVVGLVTLVVALRRKWELLSVHVVFLVLIGLRFGLPDFSEAEAVRPSDLTLMTFNVPRWGGLTPEVKARRLRRLVQKETPDLVSLQEAQTLFGKASDTLDGRTMPYVRMLTDSMGYRAVQPRKETYTPQPVLSRLPLSKPSQASFRVNAGERTPTRVMRTRFHWKGRKAVLYNIHLRSFGPEKPWQAEDPKLFDMRFWGAYLRQYRRAYRARAEEVEKIRAMLEDESLPVIVTGDFNSTPHSWAYQQLSEGMQDAFGVAGRGWGNTYHSQLPFARIDFVLASPEWKVISAHVPEVHLSDHRPLVATLRWRK